MKTLRCAYWLLVGFAAVAGSFAIGFAAGLDIAGRSDGWD